jgi:phosphoribosylformimino-5-aminoimidazole carboxamide ribotide isomerase
MLFSSLASPSPSVFILPAPSKNICVAKHGKRALEVRCVVLIFPAIDLKNGRCVRLLQGRAAEETVYFDDPVEPALAFKSAGAEWVHVVDLDGAFTGVPHNLASVARIAATGLRVELGGGMRTLDNVEQAFHAGAQRVVIGTRACTGPAFVQGLVHRFGPERLAVGIDARDGRVAVDGWVNISTVRTQELARRVCDLGIQTLIHTDIATDGMLTGPNYAAQTALLLHSPARLIASGGVATRDDIARFATMARAHPRLEGVIVGKAIYEKKVDLADLIALAKNA